MMAHIWTARLFDGKTAVPQTVQVEVLSEGLRVTFDDARQDVWAFGTFDQTQGHHVGELVCFEKKGVLTASLSLNDVSILDAIRAQDTTTPVHNLKIRKFRVPIVGGAAVGVVLMGWLIYVYGLSLAVGLAVRVIPVSWENALGVYVLDHIAPKEKRCDHDAYSVVLNEMVRRLTAHRELPYTFRVYVVDDATFNAFALPGGHIAFYSGLLKSIQTPEQLAGIMAHEIQHVVQQHGTRRLLRGLSTRVLIAAVSGGESGVDFVLDWAALAGFLRFSRSTEAAADRAGMKMVLDAHIDPKGMVESFELIRQIQGDTPAFWGYVSSHPLTVDRIHMLEPYVDSLKVDAVPIVSDVVWETFKDVVDSGGCAQDAAVEKQD